MDEQQINELSELTAQRRWNQVSEIVQKLVRRKLDGDLFRLFAPLLCVKEYVIYKYAIGIVGKMKKPPTEAFDAVLAAWQNTWTHHCPQCTDEALKALLALQPDNPRIINEVERCLTIDNYQVQKDCATALMKIDSPRAREVLANFETYMPREYTEKLMLALFEKIRAFLHS
jgi:hypothetical protein